MDKTLIETVSKTKVQSLLVQSLGFKIQSLQLSTINSNPPLAYITFIDFHQFHTVLSDFDFAPLS